MLDSSKLAAEISAIEPEVISYRRLIHTFAEVGGTEVKTSAFVKEKLEEFGIPYVPLEGFGIVGILDTGRPGPHIGLRADLDALPMAEDRCNLKGERAVISDTPDKTCHACGHDAHAAMLIGTAKVLSSHKDELCGVIYFAFESGEENGVGFKPMMAELNKHPIDTFWAIHVLNYIPAGQICVQPGPRMAGAAVVDITFKGKGGHGSRPDLAVNPVFCAANYLNNLAVAFANQIDANETVTLGITSILGGGTHNIIAETARVIGTLRFFSETEGRKASELVREVAESTAKYSRCEVEYGEAMSRFGTPLVNDKYYSSIISDRLAQAIGSENVVNSVPWYASEPFGLYLRQYPGVMAHLGIKNDELGSGAEHHNSKFDIDESALRIGVTATVEYVLGVIEKGVKPKEQGIKGGK